MTLSSFDPFSTFDRILSGSGFGESGAARSLGLPVDIYQDDDKFIIEIDAPGIDPDHLDLQVERNRLSVSGERPARHGGQALLCERPHARFTRQILLGSDLDTEHVAADYENGVLTITIPMKNQARARRIQISGTSGRQAIDAESSEQPDTDTPSTSGPSN